MKSKKDREHELELMKIQQSISQWQQGIGLLTLLVKCAVGLGALYIFMAGIAEITSTSSTDQIHALTKFAHEMNAGYLVYGLFAALGIGAYARERSGKKRAIKKLGEQRKLNESKDPGGRTTSNLTETGDTPRGRR